MEITWYASNDLKNPACGDGSWDPNNNNHIGGAFLPAALLAATLVLMAGSAPCSGDEDLDQRPAVWRLCVHLQRGRSQPLRAR